MLTQTRLVWIGLIIAICFGLAIEILKSTRSNQDGSSLRPRIFGMQDLEADGNETFDNRSAKAQRARSRLLKARVAGLADTSALIAPPVAAVVATPPVPNLTPLKLTQSEEAKKKAADAAKKKKKKKKKKSSDEQAIAQSPAPTSSSDDKPKKSSSDVSGGSSMYGGPTHNRTIIMGAAAAANENPETLDQWLAYILREPNYDRVNKMILGHEAHTVDSEIFHEVITQMLADSRGKMHEYAIVALSSAPSLKSFLLLEMANINEPEGSSLKVMSRTALKAYAKLENLRYLAGVISGGDQSNSAFEAMRLIQFAVTEYKPKATPPKSGPSTSSVAVSRQFSSLVPILTRVANMSTDATLKREAATTLQHVQTIVGNPTTPAA
jgi:hypothetical protein